MVYRPAVHMGTCIPTYYTRACTLQTKYTCQDLAEGDIEILFMLRLSCMVGRCTIGMRTYVLWLTVTQCTLGPRHMVYCNNL